MNHFDALTFSRYVDDDLAAFEAKTVREHLAVCGECAALVRALENENRVLRAAFAEVELPATLAARVNAALFGQAPALGPAMLYAGGILAAVFAGIYYLASLFQSESLVQPLSWFDVMPTSSGSWVDWIFRTFFFFYEEGWTMLLNSVERLAALAVALVALRAALPWLRRRWTTLLGASFCAMLLLALTVADASAVDIRHAHRAGVRVSKDEVIHDTLVAVGQTVVVEGTVEGDLVAVGQRIEVQGEVKGDLIAAGNTIIIAGTVENNAFVAAQRVSIDGQVKRNVYSAGEHVELAKAANVGGAVFAAAAHGMVDGKIGDSLIAAMTDLQVTGDVAKNIRLHGVHFTLLSGAHVGGDLIARTHQPAVISPDAKVDGKTLTQIIRRTSPYMTRRFYFFRVIWLLAAFVVGIILLKVFPNFYAGASEGVGSIWRSLGLGLAVLAAVPIAAIAVGITLVGLPLALITIVLYLVGLYLAKIFVGAYLGRRLLQLPPEGAYTSLGGLFLGLFILTVVGSVPYLGGLVRFIVLLGGLGALVWQLYSQMKTGQKVAA